MQLLIDVLKVRHAYTCKEVALTNGGRNVCTDDMAAAAAGRPPTTRQEALKDETLWRTRMGWVALGL